MSPRTPAQDTHKDRKRENDEQKPRDTGSPATPEATPLTPAEEKIGEGPGNLRDREADFKRRRGTTR